MTTTTQELIKQAQQKQDEVKFDLLTMPELPNPSMSQEQVAEVKSMLGEYLAEQVQTKAKSNNEMKTRLAICGNVYRALRTTFRDGKPSKYEMVPESVTAQYIRALGYVRFVTNNYVGFKTPLMVYSFESGLYLEDDTLLGIYTDCVEPNYKARNDEEVIRKIKKLARDDNDIISPCEDENLTLLGNGIFDTLTKELKPFNPDIVFTTKVNTNYVVNAKEPVFEDGWTFEGFLKEQFNNEPSSIYAMYQVIQAALLVNMAKNVFVYFYSREGRTGKGTMTELLRNMVGVSNSESANIEQLDQQFGLESVYKKSLIFGNENDNVFSSKSVNIKNLASGDALTVSRKGLPNITVRMTPLIVQSMNTTPVFTTIDGGIKNRMRVFEFQKSYYGEDNTRVKNEYVKNKELLEYLAYKVLNMEVETIVDSDTSRRVKGDIEMDSNPVLVWFEERVVDLQSPAIPVSILFADFVAWATKAGYRDKLQRRGWMNRLLPIIEDSGLFNYHAKNKSPNMIEEELRDMIENIDSVETYVVGKGKAATLYNEKKRGAIIERV